jgi:ribosomal protein L7/L12
VKEKQNFKVTLESFDAKKKLVIIKELKTLLSVGLKEVNFYLKLHSKDHFTFGII